MADGEIRLNLGCGFVYKPGYVNIDKFDTSIADKICDVGDLPFKSNTVGLIEASQLAEHFDYIHLKYVLSEWFRVLEPKGTLMIETPDLEKTFKKFVSADLETQKTTLQWIYGIDSQGMGHKTGFTFDLLRDLIGEIGFTGISLEKQRTHTYEPGMRVVCRKPSEHREKQFFACFRKRLKTRLGIDDSYLLIPLEKWISRIRDFDLKEDSIDELISMTVICTPHIPLALLEECVSSGLVEESEVTDKLVLPTYLLEKEFHRKVLSLWMKSRKRGGMEKEFTDFISRIKSTITGILREGGDYTNRLDYILNLEPSEIEFFDFDLIIQKAGKLSNLGVKHFHEHEFSESLDYFRRSSEINPADPLVYWNIARLGCLLGFEKHTITGSYERALNLIGDNTAKKNLRMEADYAREDRTDLIPNNPVTAEGLVH